MPENTTTVTVDPELDGDLLKREYLAHFIDASFDASNPSYVRIGTDLESYEISMNAEVETKKNICGVNKTTVKKYEPQSEVDTYYAREGSVLYPKLEDIVNRRLVGNSIKTTVVDIRVNGAGEVQWAYREDAVIVVQSHGGDTEAIGIPYNIYYNGNRVAGDFNVNTKTFTVGTTNTTD